ncbi:hypothetical protein JTB14_004185 [Gonioctena quinquepunctata]|nr:hypothetical protein JTB14_004185 [Gonioctena quinquepunctata]
MAEVVEQVGGNDQEAVANENGEVLKNGQLPAVDDDIGELHLWHYKQLRMVSKNCVQYAPIYTPLGIIMQMPYTGI